MKGLFLAVGIALATSVVVVDGQSHRLQPLLVVRLDAAPAPTPNAAPTRNPQPGTARPRTPRPGTPDPTQLLQPLPVVHLDDPGASATLDAVRPLSLRFSEPLAIRDVLLLLVRGTGLSLATEPGVDGTFVGELTGVTLRQAFDLVLHPQGLDYSVTGTAVRVFRRRVETRFFDVNVPLAERRPEGAIAAASLDDLAASVGALLSPDGRFALDRTAGVLQVTDYPERLDRVALFVETVERRLRRQVEIQARVVEVTLTDPSATFVNWSAALQKALGPAPSRTGTMDFDAFVRALGEQGTVTVLASPRVQATHNETAVMRVGVEDVSFVRGTDADRQVPILDGFALAVVPHITADGVIVMRVSPSVTGRTGETRTYERQRVPVTTVSEVSTSVRLRDGETLVLPGLRRERERQAPAANGFAALFRRAPAQKTYSELAVLLTARVKS